MFCKVNFPKRSKGIYHRILLLGAKVVLFLKYILALYNNCKVYFDYELNTKSNGILNS